MGLRRARHCVKCPLKEALHGIQCAFLLPTKL